MQSRFEGRNNLTPEAVEAFVGTHCRFGGMCRFFAELPETIDGVVTYQCHNKKADRNGNCLGPKGGFAPVNDLD